MVCWIGRAEVGLAHWSSTPGPFVAAALGHMLAEDWPAEVAPDYRDHRVVADTSVVCPDIGLWEGANAWWT
jgi:hypothetical protein